MSASAMHGGHNKLTDNDKNILLKMKSNTNSKYKRCFILQQSGVQHFNYTFPDH